MTKKKDPSYDDLYPNAVSGDIYDEDMLASAEQHPCWNCNKLTRFIEVNFEAPLCSPACVTQKDKEYWEAVAQ